MAKLMVIGKVAQVEILTDPEDGSNDVKCRKHNAGYGKGLNCRWSSDRFFFNMGDAVNEAEIHADGMR